MQYFFLTKYNGMFLGPIASVLGYILNALYVILSKVGIENVGICIIAFTFIVNGLMIPLTIKQQKFTKLSAKMSPELSKIQAKYKGKKDEASLRASQLETQALYEKYGTSPAGGCLPMLLTFPIMLALYRVMYNIPAYVEPVKAIYEKVAVDLQSTGIVEKLATFINGQEGAISNAVVVSTKGWGELSQAFLPGTENSVNHIVDVLTQFRPDHWDVLQNTFPSAADAIATVSDQVAHVNTFLGMNITDKPVLLSLTVIIPILAVVTQIIQTKLMTSNTQNNSQDATAQTMKTMNTVMPFISGFFCLMMPIGVGIYWIANSTFRIIQTIFVERQMDKVDIDDLIQKNVMKARKKKEKLGLDPDATMKQVSALRTSALNDSKPVTTTKSVKKSQNRSDYKKGELHYEKGSISSIANVLGGGKSDSKKEE